MPGLLLRLSRRFCTNVWLVTLGSVRVFATAARCPIPFMSGRHRRLGDHGASHPHRMSHPHPVFFPFPTTLFAVGYQIHSWPTTTDLAKCTCFCVQTSSALSTESLVIFYESVCVFVCVCLRVRTFSCACVCVVCVLFLGPAT
jgi:hypothetical protein